MNKLFPVSLASLFLFSCLVLADKPGQCVVQVSTKSAAASAKAAPPCACVREHVECDCVPGHRADNCACGKDCPCEKLNKNAPKLGGECKGCGKDCKCQPRKRAADCKCGKTCPVADGVGAKAKQNLAQGKEEARKAGKPVVLWIGCKNTDLQNTLTEFVHCFEDKIEGAPYPCVVVGKLNVYPRQYTWTEFKEMPTADQVRVAAGLVSKQAPLCPNGICPLPPVPPPPGPPSREWTAPRPSSYLPLPRLPIYRPARGGC